jgi:hypothetical protein
VENRPSVHAAHEQAQAVLRDLLRRLRPAGAS